MAVGEPGVCEADQRVALQGTPSYSSTASLGLLSFMNPKGFKLPSISLRMLKMPRPTGAE
jgi:hypothetical protein